MSVVRKSILAVALMASSAAYGGTPGWSVSESSGPVFVAKPGLSKTSAITRGAALSAGDVISTGKGGRAVIVRGGEYLTVAPNTKVQLTEPKAGALTQIIQSFGNVVFKIQKKTTPHFQVNTPYLAAVVKGTTFSVTVTPAGASVQVTEGLVQVQSLDGLASRFVSPGEIGMISSAAPGQLSVLGVPNAPSTGTTVIGTPAPAADTAPVASPTANNAPDAQPLPAPTVSEIAEVRIAAPIGEGTVNLAAQTGGIVSGNSSLAQAAVVEAVVAQPSVEAPVPAPVTAPVLAEAAPAAPVVETTPTIVAEAPPPMAVVEAPAPVVAEVTPPAPVLETPAAVVAEAPPAPAVVETPAKIVAEVTPPAPVLEAPPVLVAEAAPAPAVVETPAAQPPVLVAELATPGNATPNVPEVAAANANLGNGNGNGKSNAVSETPAAQPPVLVAELETPGNAKPAVPEVAAGNANLGNGNGNGNNSANSSSASPANSKPVKMTSLSDLLKALSEAAKLAAASPSKPGKGN